ncbi:MAG TPA: BPTI/Kunitz domain-containing protein [Edaphocola sp.]|nr:BPTI/Kunitz domain-containing protein [Edaphocola sp.]
MKYLFFTLVSAICLTSMGCGKAPACGTVSPSCLDRPLTNQACQAIFNRWFYNQQTNTCELISYTGCDASGFKTEEECMACKCHE